MTNLIKKVTAFVTRETDLGLELLLFEHPFAGIQIPAGTVESNESPEEAVLREVREETGLAAVELQTHLGTDIEELPASQRVTIPPATVYARPDLTSFDWISIRWAVHVNIDRQESDFTQITFIENDREPNPNYTSLQITGWVPNKFLATALQRDFYHLVFTGESPQNWEIYSDYYTFRPFWAPLNNLPSIIAPQDQWLKNLAKKFEIQR